MSAVPRTTISKSSKGNDKLPRRSPPEPAGVRRADGDAQRLALARAFGVRLATAWWQALTAEDDSQQPLQAPLTPIWSNSQTPLPRLAASLDPARAAYQIGLIYTGMLPPEYRGEFGIYYTPPSLTARPITQASVAGVDWMRAHVLGPARGG